MITADQDVAWRSLPVEAKAKFRDRLASRVALARLAVRAWVRERRPEQVLPLGLWLVWLILAGRGWGKTRTGAEVVNEWALAFPGCRIALVAATFQDGRDTMVEGESGLLAVIDPIALRGGSIDTAWNRSTGELYWSNGSRAKVYSSERPNRLRGPQFHFAWGDELAAWLDADKYADTVDTTWSNLLFALRLKARPGWGEGFRPRIVVTTTPKPVALLRVPPATAEDEPTKAGLTQRDTTLVTLGRTRDNLANLSDVYRENVIDPLEGTRLARQELDAEILDDVPGAWISLRSIERARVRIGDVPTVVNRVTAIDPATTSTATSDETGIITCSVDAQAEVYVEADCSGVYRPGEWARVAWEEVLRAGSMAVVVEDNQGGDMCEHTLMIEWSLMGGEYRRRGKMLPPMPPIVRVTPHGTLEGKWMRAQPIGDLYDHHRVHHVHDPTDETGRNRLQRLEDQAITWTGDKREDSPDRVDALVHGISYLVFPARRAAKAGKKAPARQSQGQRWQGRGRRG